MEKLSSVAILKKFFTDLKTEELQKTVMSTETRIELADLAATAMGYTKSVDAAGVVSYTK